MDGVSEGAGECARCKGLKELARDLSSAELDARTRRLGDGLLHWRRDREIEMAGGVVGVVKGTEGPNELGSIGKGIDSVTDGGHRVDSLHFHARRSICRGYGNGGIIHKPRWKSREMHIRFTCRHDARPN